MKAVLFFILKNLRGCLLKKAASYFLERVKGVEPSYRPWEGRVLPMNYTRMILFHYTIESGKIQPNFGSHLEHVEFNEFFEDELYKVQKSLGTVAKIRSQLHGKVQQIGHWAAWVKASFLLEKTNK